MKEEKTAVVPEPTTAEADRGTPRRLRQPRPASSRTWRGNSPRPQLMDEIEEKIALAIYRLRLKPTLALAQRLLEEIETLRTEQGGLWRQFVGLPWEQWLAKHPEWRPQMDLAVEKVRILAREALTVMQLASRATPLGDPGGQQAAPRHGGLPVQANRRRGAEGRRRPRLDPRALSRAEHALKIIQPILERHGMRFAPLVAGKGEIMTETLDTSDEPQSPTVESAQRRILDMRMDPSHPLNNPNDPRHSFAVKDVERLYKTIDRVENPTAPRGDAAAQPRDPRRDPGRRPQLNASVRRLERLGFSHSETSDLLKYVATAQPERS